MGKFNISNLDLYYTDFHALKNVNLDLPEKEITAFIGPSGCGKSTLLKSLNRMNDLVEGCKITGEITLDGVDIYKNIASMTILPMDREPTAFIINPSLTISLRSLCAEQPSGMK